ncbi:MAG: hypothetical protein R6U85_11570 [Salinivirgaceae bacterium]
MKRTVKLSLLALIAIALVSFVSCVEDESEQVEKSPEITIKSPSTDTIYTHIGETIVFDLTFISQSSNASLMIIPNVMGVDIKDELISLNGSGSINKNIEIKAKITNILSEGMTFDVSFTAQDEYGSDIKHKKVVIQ